MKSEPETYGIDDLAAKNGPDIWEGCRNYTVRNYMRDVMDEGDLAFFHHSNSSPAGIVGVMKIVKRAYPDPTQFDPTSRYHDPKSSPDAPRWLSPDVLFLEKFARTIDLNELRAQSGLEQMHVTRKGQRLSVMPVTDTEWQIVMELAKR